MNLYSLAAVRRENLRRLADQHGATVIAKTLGYASVAFLSQMIGPNPTRTVTERTARTVEQAMGLEPGVLDLDFEVHAETAA